MRTPIAALALAALISGPLALPAPAQQADPSPPPPPSGNADQDRSSAQDAEFRRQREALVRELQILEAKAALKRAEIQKLEAEHRLRQLGEGVGDAPISRPSPRASRADLDRRTLAILDALDRPVPMDFPNETRLEDIIKYMRRATASPALPDGIPCYVDPTGIIETGKSVSSPVRINLVGVPLKRSLKLVLNQLGMTYTVRDGLLSIVAKPVAVPLRSGVVGADTADPRSKAIYQALDRLMPMPFPDRTPLAEVVKYIKSSSVGPGLPEGIPIYIDPNGLEKAKRSMDSPVSLSVEGWPLRQSLEVILERLDLDYDVQDGLLKITSADAGRTARAIAEALERTTTLALPDDTPLDDVLSRLRSATRSAELPRGLPIHFDPETIPSAVRALDAKVRVEAKDLPVGKALEQALRPLGLTYVVRDGSILITSAECRDRSKDEKSRRDR
jgi:hypothetical protein